MFQQLIVFPLTTYAKTSSLPMPVFRSGQSPKELVFVATFYAPPVVDALVGLWLLKTYVSRKFSAEHAALTFLLALSAFFYCQALTRSDLHHLLIALAPFFVVAGWSAARAAKGIEAVVAGSRFGVRMKWAISPACFAVSVVGASCFLLIPLIELLNLSRLPLVNLDLPRGGVHVEPATARDLTILVRSIQTRVPAGRSMLSLPYNAALYFLCERRNPTRWNYLWPGDQTPDEHRAFIEQAKRDPPAIVILQGEEEMATYARPIVDYVK
jgi:hypothetical protein